jgi:hypothetical protein
VQVLMCAAMATVQVERDANLDAERETGSATIRALGSAARKRGERPELELLRRDLDRCASTVANLLDD